MLKIDKYYSDYGPLRQMVEPELGVTPEKLQKFHSLLDKHRVTGRSKRLQK